MSTHVGSVGTKLTHIYDVNLTFIADIQMSLEIVWVLVWTFDMDKLPHVNPPKHFLIKKIHLKTTITPLIKVSDFLLQSVFPTLNLNFST